MKLQLFLFLSGSDNSEFTWFHRVPVKVKSKMFIFRIKILKKKNSIVNNVKFKWTYESILNDHEIILLSTCKDNYDDNFDYPILFPFCPVFLFVIQQCTYI